MVEMLLKLAVIKLCFFGLAGGNFDKDAKKNHVARLNTVVINLAFIVVGVGGNFDFCNPPSVNLRD